MIEEFHRRTATGSTSLGIDFQDFQTEKAGELVDRAGVTYPLVEDPGGDINGAGAIPLMRGLPFWRSSTRAAT